MDGPLGHDASLLHALIRGRRSVRRYRPDAVPAALLHRLVETACWAPSAHNRQPWRFVILDKDAKASLARAMAERLTADRTADGDDPADIAADAARSVARIDGAPAALLVCLTLAEMDRYVDARRAAAERIMAIQSTAMAVQNLLLAAHAEGLGASWMCAPLFCVELVRSALALPVDFEPQALITLGWPAASTRPRARKPAADVVRTASPSRDGA
jgi:F420 biosynthesis protein FbiB-like protein